MIIEKIKKTVRETHAPICKRDLLWISLLLLKEKETLNQRGRWRFFFFYFRLTVTALTVFQPFFSCLRLLPLLKILFSSKSKTSFLFFFNMQIFLRREKILIFSWQMRLFFIFRVFSVDWPWNSSTLLFFFGFFFGRVHRDSRPLFFSLSVYMCVSQQPCNVFREIKEEKKQIRLHDSKRPQATGSGDFLYNKRHKR